MESLNALVEMQKKYLSMTEVEKRIAEYILANPYKAVHMTTRSLSCVTGVSEGSIINFAKNIGLGGFTKLKLNLAQNAEGFDNYEFDDIQKDDSAKSALRKIMDNSIRSFLATFDTLSADVLESTANAIMQAKKRIEIYGVGSSSMIASDAYYRFMRIGLPVYAVTDPHISSISASMLDENCLAIGISYSGRTKETLRTMEIAKSKNAKTICLTGYSESPMAKLCDINIVIVSRETEINKEAVASRLAQLLVLDGLCTYIAYKRKNTSLEMITSMVEIIEEHRE